MENDTNLLYAIKELIKDTPPQYDTQLVLKFEIDLSPLKEVIL